MLSSPRKPVSTMRIFSSAENCRRVARRIPFTTCSAGSFTGPDFCPICAPSMATMGQKSSLPQLTRSVSVVLMPDTLLDEERSDGQWYDAERGVVFRAFEFAPIEILVERLNAAVEAMEESGETVP